MIGEQDKERRRRRKKHLMVLVVAGGDSLDTSGVGSSHADTALTRVARASTTSQTDVTTLTPGSTPRVLDEPVSLAIVGTIAGSEHTMIEGGTAAGGEDTTTVELPGLSIHSHRDGAGSDGSLELVLVVDGHIHVLGDGEHGLAAGRSAVVVGGSVRVVRFGAETAIGNDELESLVHQTTTAALVALSSGAVHQLLFRDGDGGINVVVHSITTFNGASGGESPARTALLLVLDRGDGTLATPVNGGRSVLDVGVGAI